MRYLLLTALLAGCVTPTQAPEHYYTKPSDRLFMGVDGMLYPIENLQISTTPYVPSDVNYLNQDIFTVESSSDDFFLGVSTP